jgi:hypothetical protein
MGYALNELANLPVDDGIHFYIFVVNGSYREPLYDMIQQNFIAIAKSIGSNAVIAVGTDPKAFSSQVEKKYFGQSDTSFFHALPALLITNAHPDKLTKDSVRLIVPLRDAESRFGGWQQFFDLLSSFVKGESAEFLDKFQKKEDLLDAANKVFNVRPGMFGVSVNVNELLDRWRKKQA